MIVKEFDVKEFRNLTQRVFDAEKPGFWSDWTEEEQKLYQSGEWEAFSRSRGYSEEEIAECREWLEMLDERRLHGLNPFIHIKDLADKKALENIAKDKKGEIMKSSHFPTLIPDGQLTKLASGFDPYALILGLATGKELPIPFSRAVLREVIARAEDAIADLPGAVFGNSDLCPNKHTFCKGLYIREIHIPKGVILTGAIHREETPSFVLEGDMSVITENGIQRVKAPLHMISPPGNKRLGYAHTDVRWITVHPNPNELRDIEELENKYLADSFEELSPSYIRIVKKDSIEVKVIKEGRDE